MKDFSKLKNVLVVLCKSDKGQLLRLGPARVCAERIGGSSRPPHTLYHDRGHRCHARRQTSALLALRSAGPR